MGRNPKLAGANRMLKASLSNGSIRQIIIYQAQFNKMISYIKRPNVVGWVAILLCIRKVSGTNLGPEVDYSD
jgi:hypothetical protein